MTESGNEVVSIQHDVKPSTFGEMFKAEWVEVRERRKKARYCAEDGGAGAAALPPDNLTGIALSGGGIRSATFSLGLLQGLNGNKRLTKFDYLSTVSGGGYVGGWWSAWLARTESASSAEPDPRQRGGKEVFPPPEKLPPFSGVEEQEREISRQETSQSRLTAATDGAEALSYGRDKRRSAKEKNVSEETYRDCASAGDDPIHHLRLFGNYLTPRKGALSADTWRAVTVITRNILLTWLVLLPLLVALILTAQLYFLAQPAVPAVFDPPDLFYSAGWRAGTNAEVLLPRLWLVIWAVLGFGLWITALICAWMINSGDAGSFRKMAAGWAGAFVVGVIFCAVALVVLNWSSGPPVSPRPTYKGGLLWIILGAGVMWYALHLPGKEGVGGGHSTWLKVVGRRREVRRNKIVRTHAKVLVALTCVTLLLLFAGFGHELVNFLRSPGGIPKLLAQWGGLGAVLLALFGSIYTALKTAPAGGHDSREIARPSLVGRLVLTVTPPLVLVVLAVGAAWVVNLFLSGVNDRYANARIAAFAALLNAVTCLGIALVLYFALAETHWKSDEANEGGTAGKGRESKPLEHFAVLLFIIILAVIALLKFWGSAQRLTKWWPFHVVEVGGWSSWLESAFLIVGLIACAVFLLLLLSLASKKGNSKSLALLGGASVALIVIAFLVHPGGLSRLLDNSDRVRLIQTVCGMIGSLLTWVIAFGWMADPNALSLHLFYKGRLVRAYLGASNLRRGGNFKQISEATEGDDVPMSLLKNCQRGAPYHLVNTTLNLVGGGDLATAQRSSDSFIMSKLYCGSSRTGYRPTKEYMSNRLSLGTAVAVSGAAASPSMGSMTFSAPLVMLMTLLNVRLGFWAPTPNKVGWRETSARFWPYYVLRELLSQTNDLSAHCNLTDGGHFDNTALYPLAARACKQIIVADCGADPGPLFSDLGIAIRRCRIDFNADITLDIKALERAAADKRPGAIYAAGDILYDDRHLRALLPERPEESFSEDAWEARCQNWIARHRAGKIYVVKPGLTGARDEAADVRQYGMQNENFPQQSTADFWYDEAQFESYRRLGEHCADVLEGVIAAEQ